MSLVIFTVKIKAVTKDKNNTQLMCVAETEISMSVSLHTVNVFSLQKRFEQLRAAAFLQLNIW